MIVAMKFYGLLLVSLLATAPLQAQEEMLPAPVLDGIYAGLEPKPAQEFLTVAEFDDYTRLLADLKCYEALFMMLDKFGAAHPDWPSPMLNNRHVQSWYRDLGETYYPEVFFCLNVQQVREAQAQITRDDIAADRYMGDPDDINFPDQVERRNFGVFNLVNQAKANYPLAFLELARLSAVGEIVRFSAVYQYYLLLRAGKLGLQSDELDKLLSAARWRLTPFEIASFESADYRTQLAINKPVYE